MKKLGFILAILLLLTLAGCSSEHIVLYEGVLERISTTKGVTTFVFVDNTVVSKNYNENYNSDAALILGKKYDLMEFRLTGENIVYLQMVKEQK